MIVLERFVKRSNWVAKEFQSISILFGKFCKSFNMVGSEVAFTAYIFALS